MEDKHSKPLRPSSNKIKDLYNTYIKNEEPRTPNIHKEKDIISEKMEKELEDKIEAALNKEGKTVQNDANTINNNFDLSLLGCKMFFIKFKLCPWVISSNNFFPVNV